MLNLAADIPAGSFFGSRSAKQRSMQARPRLSPALLLCKIQSDCATQRQQQHDPLPSLAVSQ